jgi:hypothetical protein
MWLFLHILFNLKLSENLPNKNIATHSVLIIQSLGYYCILAFFLLHSKKFYIKYTRGNACLSVYALFLCIQHVLFSRFHINFSFFVYITPIILFTNVSLLRLAKKINLLNLFVKQNNWNTYKFGVKHQSIIDFNMLFCFCFQFGDIGAQNLSKIFTTKGHKSQIHSLNVTSNNIGNW